MTKTKERIEANDFIETFIDQAEEIVPAELSAKIVAEWRERDPEGLAVWLDERASVFVHEEVTRRLGRRRHISRVNARAFAEQASAFVGDGNVTPEDAQKFSGYFRATHCVNENFVQKRVADMTGPEHFFVADQYEDSGNRDLLMAAFHRAVGKKVGNRKTSDVFSEREYARMMGRTLSELDDNN